MNLAERHPWTQEEQDLLIAAVLDKAPDANIYELLNGRHSLFSIKKQVSKLRARGRLPKAEGTQPRFNPCAQRRAQGFEKPASPQSPGMRRCLGGCGKEFWSENANYRICPSCRHVGARKAACTAFDTPHAVRV